MNKIVTITQTTELHLTEDELKDAIRIHLLAKNIDVSGTMEVLNNSSSEEDVLSVFVRITSKSTK